MPSGDDIKKCVYGVFRGQGPLTEGTEEEVGGHCQVVGSSVSETRSFSFREHLGSRASVPLGMPVRAHGEWRDIL